MPVRNKQVQNEQVKQGYPELIDLSFLPEKYIKRIDDIFDSYFSLGMKKRVGSMEDNSPIFPSKISTLTSPQLGDTLSQFTAWSAYASDKHKYVIVANNFIEQEMQKVLDLELGQLTLEKGNIETKKSQARSSQSYMLLVSYHQKLIGLKTLLDKEVGNFERCIASISREVSRREHHGGY